MFARVGRRWGNRDTVAGRAHGSRTAPTSGCLDPRDYRLFVWVMVTVMLLSGAGPASADVPPGFNMATDVWPTAVAPATCRPNDRIETGLQGEVTTEDRRSGRSTQGYNCNIDLVGQLQGQGASFVSASYKNCAYIASTRNNGLGVRVIDVSDPAHPKLTAILNDAAMFDGTWESLKVHAGRGLLAGTGAGFGLGVGYIALYDIAGDCAHPRLLNTERGSLPGMRIPMLTHEGNFSPDGNTYWATGQLWASAVDVSDPSSPNVVWSAPAGFAAHGVDFTPDGDTLFMSTINGINVLDSTAVQDRAAAGTMHQLLPMRSDVHWADGLANQHSIYVTYHGVPHLFNVQEAGSGGVRLFDASDLSNLTLRNNIKLEIDLPTHQDRAFTSASNNGFFSYDPHYCSVDRRDDPQALACGWQQSGVRVFDVRNPDDIPEIAYYNPPAAVGREADLTNSTHIAFTRLAGAQPILSALFPVARAILDGDIQGPDAQIDGRRFRGGADLTADWCMSPPEFRGNLLYVTCSDNGFQVLRLDPSIYPPT
ncbi:LVIVD repeat-containing protein [Mycolicibacterium setense]|uniref:LVIVD repeat-containing protein n=1 Tax=Mycolicibacterium setense TaxID=431269 RepID=UPI001F1AA4E7|nr:hypothetical protein [Mycolicibacterium setense]